MGFKVIIIGGGLAAALLANGLSNSNVEVMVYERYGENSKRESYQIRLGEAAMEGFHVCLQEDQIAAILGKFGQSEGTTATAPSLYNSRYELLLDLAKIPSYTKSAAINRVVLRDAFIQPMVDSGRVRYGKAFSDFSVKKTEDGQERVCVEFMDGSSDMCDLLVGADGSASKVNRQLGLKNLVQLNSHWTFLAKGTLSSKIVRSLPRNLQQGPMFVFSKGASLYYALYMPPKQEAANRARKSTVEFDETASSFYWGLNIPKSHVPIKNLSEISDRLQFCLEYIKDWGAQYHIMLRAGQVDEDHGGIHAVELRASTKPPRHWRVKLQSGSEKEGHPRVWLLGDAIHAMQPNRPGMGGNQAMCDCADILPEIVRLNEHVDHPSTEVIRAACERYEDAMIDRAFIWVKKSGGSSVPLLDFDGLLGYILYLVGMIYVPLATLYKKVFN